MIRRGYTGHTEQLSIATTNFSPRTPPRPNGLCVPAQRYHFLRRLQHVRPIDGAAYNAQSWRPRNGRLRVLFSCGASFSLLLVSPWINPLLPSLGPSGDGCTVLGSPPSPSPMANHSCFLQCEVAATSAHIVHTLTRTDS